MAFSSFDQVLVYLDSIPKFQTAGKSAARFDLDRFRKFCDAIGNPQQAFSGIHVGGTNGKGSTCHILASVYQQGGYRVGIYTSPHILRYTERFQINGEQIPESKLVDFFNSFETLIKGFRLSYFELSTAIAFWYFADQEVDLGIIEVGLGGRLDATNIITPLVSVITNVSADHTDILGETIEEIAREKAGIIKQGVPVILGNVSEEAAEVIERAAEDKESAVFETGSLRPRYRNGKFELHLRRSTISLKSGLFSPIQAHNIAVAWRVCEVLQNQRPLTRDEFSMGVTKVRSIYPGLGRFEKLVEGREWYFDGAHNLEAVKAMKDVIRTLGAVEEAVLVLSIMDDKVNKQLLNEFSEFNKIFYHILDNQRAAAFERIEQGLPAVELFPASEKQRKRFFEEFESELVIFAGSFYFYSTVRDWLASFAYNR